MLFNSSACLPCSSIYFLASQLFPISKIFVWYPPFLPNMLLRVFIINFHTSDKSSLHGTVWPLYIASSTSTPTMLEESRTFLPPVSLRLEFERYHSLEKKFKAFKTFSVTQIIRMHSYQHKWLSDPGKQRLFQSLWYVILAGINT